MIAIKSSLAPTHSPDLEYVVPERKLQVTDAAEVFSESKKQNSPASKPDISFFIKYSFSNHLFSEKLYTHLHYYSTVTEYLCGYAFLNADVFFRFTITQRTSNLNIPQYSQYQFFLYETITAHREKGKTFDQIGEWLNKKGYLSVRGKKFKGNHIHSIVTKKRLKDEKLEREYPEEWTDFSLEVIDKTLVNRFEGF